MPISPTPPAGNGPPIAADLNNLVAIKSNLLQTLAAETDYQARHGAKPSYSLDGKSLSWTEYRSAVIEKVGQLNELIQLESGPFQLSMEMTA